MYAIRSYYVTGQDRQEAKLLSIIGELAEELHPGAIQAQPLNLDSSLDRDIGLNSLARMELLVRLEREFAVSLSEQELATVESPRDILRALGRAATAAPLPAIPSRLESVITSYSIHYTKLYDRLFKGDLEMFGTADQFPYAATTYRLTEHFHFWTKHGKLNSILQPEQFVEIGEELARDKGIKAGDSVRVRSKRGYIVAVAVVTKRIRPLTVAGTTVHTVGIPIHWGFMGVAKNGYITNTLTPYVGDANTQTPEFKSFLVNIEKV